MRRPLELLITRTGFPARQFLDSAPSLSFRGASQLSASALKQTQQFNFLFLFLAQCCTSKGGVSIVPFFQPTAGLKLVYNYFLKLCTWNLARQPVFKAGSIKGFFKSSNDQFYFVVINFTASIQLLHIPGALLFPYCLITFPQYLEMCAFVNRNTASPIYPLTERSLNGSYSLRDMRN